MSKAAKAQQFAAFNGLRSGNTFPRPLPLLIRFSPRYFSTVVPSRSLAEHPTQQQQLPYGVMAYLRDNDKGRSSFRRKYPCFVFLDVSPALHNARRYEILLRSTKQTYVCTKTL